jgi:hypothetical protein
MATFDPRLYGARWADNYDEWHKGLMDDEGAVAALADFAADGPALEFGVGPAGSRCRWPNGGSR